MEGGFWVGFARGVILRGSFVGILERCARLGMFPVRMEEGSNNSRKINCYIQLLLQSVPHRANPCPSPLAAQAGLDLVSSLLGLRSDPHWESSPKGPGSAFPTPAAFPTHPQLFQPTHPQGCSGQHGEFLLLNTTLTAGDCFFQPLILELGCDLPYNSFYPRFGHREQHLSPVTQGRWARSLISYFLSSTPVSGRERKSL